MSKVRPAIYITVPKAQAVMKLKTLATKLQAAKPELISSLKGASDIEIGFKNDSRPNSSYCINLKFKLAGEDACDLTFYITADKRKYYITSDKVREVFNLQDGTEVDRQAVALITNFYKKLGELVFKETNASKLQVGSVEHEPPSLETSALTWTRTASGRIEEIDLSTEFGTFHLGINPGKLESLRERMRKLHAPVPAAKPKH